MSQKSPSFEFFDILQQNIYLKSPKDPLFTFFGTMRHFLKEKNQKFQVFSQKKVFLRFLSLRYSADFRRSRLGLDY